MQDITLDWGAINIWYWFHKWTQPFVFSGVSDGKWNGLTGLGVNLYDFPNDEDKLSKEISDVVSKPNNGGYSTARNALQTSFQNVMNGLASFVDQSPME